MSDELDAGSVEVPGREEGAPVFDSRTGRWSIGSRVRVTWWVRVGENDVQELSAVSRVIGLHHAGAAGWIATLEAPAGPTPEGWEAEVGPWQVAAEPD